MRTWNRRGKAVKPADILALHNARAKDGGDPDLSGMLTKATCGTCRSFPSEAYERLETSREETNKAARAVEELEAERDQSLTGRNGVKHYAELTGKIAKAEKALQAAQTAEAHAAVSYVEELRAGKKCLWLTIAGKAMIGPGDAACRNHRGRDEEPETVLTCKYCDLFPGRWPAKAKCMLATHAGQKITADRPACQRFRSPGHQAPPPPHWGGGRSTSATMRRIAELAELAETLQAKLDQRGGGENGETHD